MPITASRARKPPRSSVTCSTAASCAARMAVSATLVSPRAMLVTEIRPSRSPQASRSISCRRADRAASTASCAVAARRGPGEQRRGDGLRFRLEQRGVVGEQLEHLGRPGEQVRDQPRPAEQRRRAAGRPTPSSRSSRRYQGVSASASDTCRYDSRPSSGSGLEEK